MVGEIKKFSEGDRVVFAGFNDGVEDQRVFEPPVGSFGTVIETVRRDRDTGNDTHVRWDDARPQGGSTWYYNSQKLEYIIQEDF